MLDLLCLTVAWKRPDLLKLTLDSMVEMTKGLSVEFWVADNETTEESRKAILGCPAVARTVAFRKNVGINAAYQCLAPETPISRYVLAGDADMVYRVPVRHTFRLLDNHPVEAVSFQDSPEHPSEGELEPGVKRKKIERGCSILMKADRFRTLQPFPAHKKLDWDWWVFRDSPRPVRAVAVIHGGALHMGHGRSTWQGNVPEHRDLMALIRTWQSPSA